MRRERARLICLTGMDGTGKTTLANTLVAGLRKNGEDARYVYARYRPVTVRVAWAIARALMRTKKDGDYLAYRVEKRSRMQTSRLKRLYAAWLLAEYVIELQLLVRIPLMRGKTVVCDRYVFDTAIMDIGKELGYSNEGCAKLADRYLRLVPKPDHVFLLDAPVEVAFRRKNDVPHIDYLQEVRETYLHLAKRQAYPMLNAAAPQQQVADAAFELLRR